MAPFCLAPGDSTTHTREKGCKLNPDSAENCAQVGTEHKERQGQLIAILGYLEEVEAKARCDAEGMLSLKGVSVKGFRLVRVPRVWDDPDRRNAEVAFPNGC